MVTWNSWLYKRHVKLPVVTANVYSYLSCDVLNSNTIYYHLPSSTGSVAFPATRIPLAFQQEGVHLCQAHLLQPHFRWNATLSSKLAVRICWRNASVGFWPVTAFSKRSTITGSAPPPTTAVAPPLTFLAFFARLIFLAFSPATPPTTAAAPPLTFLPFLARLIFLDLILVPPVLQFLLSKDRAEASKSMSE